MIVGAFFTFVGSDLSPRKEEPSLNQTLSTKSHHLSTEQQRMIHCIRLLGDLLKERPRRSVYRRFAMEQNWPSPESIIRQFGSWAEALAIAGYEWHGESTVELPDKMPKYTREDIIETLAIYSRDMGSIITLKKYQQWRKLHPKAPSHYHIVKTFGSWHDACAEAGLEASVTYSKTELSNALREAIQEMGFSLSFEAYREWAKRNNKPSTKAILHRYGSWSAAVHAVESELYNTNS